MNFDVWRQHWMYVFTGGSIIMDYEIIYFVQKRRFKFKTPWWINFVQKFLLFTMQMLTDELKLCGLLWCFYQLFRLLFWRHPFTAEDPLVSKWCNATFLQTVLFVEEKNSFTSWPGVQYIFTQFSFLGKLFHLKHLHFPQESLARRG